MAAVDVADLPLAVGQHGDCARSATVCPPGRGRGRRRSSGVRVARSDREGEAPSGPVCADRLAGRLALPGSREGVDEDAAPAATTARSKRDSRGEPELVHAAWYCRTSWARAAAEAESVRRRGVTGREGDRGPGRGIAQEG